MQFFDTENEPDFIKKFLRLTRQKGLGKDIFEPVAAIIEEVRNKGDAALVRYAQELDGVTLQPEQFYIDLKSLDERSLPLGEAEREAINFAYRRIRSFADRVRPQDSDRGDGTDFVAQKYVPFDCVACYVPSGSFPLVSTAIHTCSFAGAAGVQDITVITSPKKEGVHPAILYAAKTAGARRILQLGGVYGIAAAAYGTQTVDPVSFIAGPGNAYVTEAKKQVFGKVGIDMLAGPSEIMVIADQSAPVQFVAADLLSQAEHGSGLEQAVLVTTSQVLYDRIEQEVLQQRALLPHHPAMDKVIDRGIFVIKACSLEECVAICNAYAPEHVEIMTEHPDALESQITSAGAIMLGPWTPEPVGDFVAGSSHVLPTGGSAHIFSGLTTGHFMKKISVQKFSREGLETCGGAAGQFSSMESLPAHGRSVSIRFDTKSG